MSRKGRNLKRLLSLAVTASMVFSLGSIQNVSAETAWVTNGGFENGSLGWSGYGGSQIVGDNANSGISSAKLKPGSGLEQTISGLNPGTIYTLTAKVKVSGTNGNITVGAEDFGGQGVNCSSSPLDYEQISVNFRTGINKTSAKIYLYMHDSASGYAYGDNVEVVEYAAPEGEYNVYFGGFHDHTSYSDGTGTPDEGFQYAADFGDFMAITDHVNPLSPIKNWPDTLAAANRNSIKDKFTGLAGFEVTTGSFHANVFNTDTYYPLPMPLTSLYSKLADDPDAIGQFNHPGWAGMNHFDNFGHRTDASDESMELLELGNGYGAMDGSDNYGWYYGSYISALDKGWHIAPANNQDNHKPTWLEEMPTRTAILSHSLDRANIIDAIKNKRVYATEDQNLKIFYRLNNEIMGSVLDNPQQLNFNISIENPESEVAVKEIRLVADGGRIIQTKEGSSHIENWQFTLAPQYSYYFFYVILEDGSRAVTAPVWTGLPTAPKMTPVITLDRTPKTSHERFVVNVSGLRPAHLADWIGLYEEGTNPDGDPRSIWYSTIQNLNIDDSGTGSFIFDPNEIPDAQRGRYVPGRNYKFIYAYDDNYTVIASKTFTINSEGVSLQDNLALNKTASASSKYDNTAAYDASKAFDGNPATSWNAAKNTAAGQWLEIDLGAPATFNKVVLKTELDRILNYKLQYHNGTEYVDILHSGQIYPLKEDIFAPVTAQKLRISILNTKTDQNGWGFDPRIAELEIYNDTNAVMPIENLAFYKTASASSNWDSNLARAVMAFDGSNDTTWNAERGTSVNEWLEVDFGKETTFNTISLNCTLDRITGYKLEYHNGSEWVNFFTGGKINPSKYMTFPAVTAQKVRIYTLATKVDQNDWGNDPSINEIAIYNH